MSKIVFTDLKATANSFSVTVSIEGAKEETVEFKAPSSIEFGNDLIAHSLSTIAARKYSEIHFDFPVSAECLSRIQDFTLCLPTAASNCEEEQWRRDETGVTLSFSGGFDSLAALAIMPKSTKLVTMDFGGNFERERLSFNHFAPLLVETNIAETSLRAASWSFMGIGAILTAKHTKSRFLTFGGIMDQSPEAFAKPSPLVANKTFPPFAACGFISAPYVIGITEVGTAKIITQAYPEKALDSLKSLSTPGSEKFIRKSLLLSYFEQKFGANFGIPTIVYPSKPQYEFGQSMVVDAMASWFVKNFGREIAEKMVSDIPPEAYEIAKNLSLNFFESYNQSFYENFPAALKPELFESLNRYGIHPYSAEDLEDFERLANMLATRRNISGRGRPE
ncbi:MAG: hypothetical protein ACSHWZ_08395 [Sulfitobacter sp.]